MVNKQRVRRIKNFIYALIIIVLFLPLILMAVLSLSMIRTMEDMSNKLDTLNLSVSQQASPPASDSGYVIEPEGQSVKNGSSEPQFMGDKNSENASDPAPTASGEQPEVSGAPPEIHGSDTGGVSANNGDAGINGSPQGTLNSDALSGSGGAGGGSSIGNPTMGSGEQSQQGYNGNPLTGR